jgi:hypothetical protein
MNVTESIKLENDRGGVEMLLGRFFFLMQILKKDDYGSTSDSELNMEE